MAKKIGASKRKSRKCTIVDILLGYWQLASMKQFSFDNWAIQISSITGKTISGQAVWKRITPEIILFLKELLNKSFRQKCDTLIDSKIFCSFENVFIQDATHFSLPRILSQAFPGSYSRYGDCATAKIQAIYNLKKGFFSDLNLCSFRDTDQKDSSRFVKALSKGDLIIRDLGYFVLNTFNEIEERQAFYLSRVRYGVSIFDLKTGKKLDLHKSLKQKKRLDVYVSVGLKHKVKCRLVAIPLSDDIVNQKRRKAKNNRSKSANHSKEYMHLLGYALYITNVPNEVWTPDDIVQAYKSRWYIEILFKGWKSNLKMQVNIPEKYMTKQRAEFFFYASLLMVNLLVMPIFSKVQLHSLSARNNISIMKLCAFLNQNIQLIIQSFDNNMLNKIKYYCIYESRKNRINAMETICLNLP